MKVQLTKTGKSVKIISDNGGWKATLSAGQALDLAGMLERHRTQHSATFTEDMKLGVFGMDDGRVVISIRGNAHPVSQTEASVLEDALDDILRD